MSPMRKKSKDQNSSTVSFDTKSKELNMATTSSSATNIPTSKTLDSVASLPKMANVDENLVDFKRNEVLLMARSDAEGGNGDFFFSGTLTVSRKLAFGGPVFEWIPQDNQHQLQDKENSQNSESHYGGSFSDREWTMITDQLSKRNVRPIEFELCELKSFRLSDDGNRLVLIQRDGTNHPPLIFLDEGPEELINVFKRYVN